MQISLKIINVLLLLLATTVLVVAGFLPLLSNNLEKLVESGQVSSLPEIPYIERPYAHITNKLIPLRDVSKYLEHAIKYRPLYAPNWLSLARHQYRKGEVEGAVDTLESAESIWPSRGYFLWIIAMEYVQIGNNKQALSTLGAYVRAYPSDIDKALLVASRLVPDNVQLVDNFLGTDTQFDEREFKILIQFFKFAIRNKNLDLAQILWGKLPDSLKETENVLDYISLLIRNDQNTAVLALWSNYTGKEQRFNEVYNSGFERLIYNGGLGWSCKEQVGFKCERVNNQYYSGRYSYLIKFSGEQNLNFHHVKQVIPVSSGKSFILSGYWRGNEITTRSGVYMAIRLLNSTNTRVNKTTPRYGSWDWQRFELEVDVPADVNFIEVSLRRNKTNALDNLLSGKVWLDEFAVVEKPTE